ncbi:hypothetical protein AB1L07_01775 [Niallia alba]|uniref:hypothetical protein n=1 Tax=Niallia alba TaxID=2729105 RepID=UPI00399F27E1
MMRIGTDYLGSDSIQQTTTTNQEIIPLPPSTWTKGYNFYRFSFDNLDACTVKINKGKPIYIRAGKGFNTDIYDSPIYSFVIIENGIRFNWIAGY